MPRKKNISVERIKEVLSYNPDTGSLTWRAKTSAWDRTGEEAAPSPAHNGYRYISLDKGDYLAHRLAYVLMTGEFPKGQLTFKDNNRLNLKWENILERKPMCKTKYDHKTPEGRSQYMKEWKAANPGKYREKSLKKDFGITLRQYEDMLIEQDGRCAICNQRETMKRGGKEVSLAVDHDHETGEIRSLLCSSCNQGLGQFKDNANFTDAATRYLRIHKSKPKLDEKVIPLKLKTS